MEQQLKCYYVMIKFDGPYVSGFVVPQATDEADAIRQLRISLWAALKVTRDTGYGDFTKERVRQFLRSVKRPWRINGGYRHADQKTVVKDTNGRQVVKIVEMTSPVLAGHWLKDIMSATELCNMRL